MNHLSNRCWNKFQTRSSKVEEAFEKYENDFRVPPDDAFRSIFRRFQGEQGSKETPTSENGQGMSQPSKKVEKLSELQGDDKNVVIEVKVISHNLRTQNVRGEERQIAFGMLEDMPWAEDEGEMGLQRLGAQRCPIGFDIEARRGFSQRISG